MSTSLTMIRSAMVWMTAIIFGLAHGEAVIVEEAQAANISPEDRELKP